MRPLLFACVALAACSSGTPDTTPSPADERSPGDAGVSLSLSSVTPNHGSVRGADAVVLAGTGFLDNVQVFFAGRTATVTAVTDTSVSVLTPPGSLGVADVSVAELGQSASLSGAFSYECAGGDLSVPAQYASITLALGAAPPGGTILVCDGNYSVLDTAEEFPLVIHDMHLVGAGASVTEINANLGARAIELSGDASVIGFTIKNGQAPLDEGGGIAITGEGSPRVAYNMFVSNRAPARGGAIFVEAPATPTIWNNVFDANDTYDEAATGGGGAAVAILHTRAVIRGNIFTDNHSSTDGGAIFLRQILDIDRLTVIDGNMFENNSAEVAGGAVMVVNGLTDKLLGNVATFTNNTFRTNGGASVENGGAIACLSDYTGPIPATPASGPTLTVRNNRFDTNLAWTGSAVDVNGCGMTFGLNDVLANTTTSSSGAAVNIQSAADGSTPTLIDSNFTGNGFLAVVGGGVLGQVDGHGNYLAENNGAVGADVTECPKGTVDGDFGTSSDGTPKQFLFVDACLAMAPAPVLATGPAGP